MAVRSKTVQSKYPPRTFQRLIKFAIDHGFLAEDDMPFGGRPQRCIVEFILKIDAHPKVEKMKLEGRTTLNIIQDLIDQIPATENSKE